LGIRDYLTPPFAAFAKLGNKFSNASEIGTGRFAESAVEAIHFSESFIAFQLAPFGDAAKVAGKSQQRHGLVGARPGQVGLHRNKLAP
jgi:hypothetical protein